MYTNNRYLHGSRSRAKSAIYIAAVCIQKIVIYTAAVQEPNRLYTLKPGVYKKSLFARQPFKSQIGYIHCCLVYTKNRYLHGSRSRAKSAFYNAAGCIQKSLFTRQPFKSQMGYIHCCRVYTKIVIYTAAVQEPNWLYTLLPGVYIDCYLHGSNSRANSAINIAAGCNT